MMKRFILLTPLLFAGLSWASAQTRITGKVTDRGTGEPVSFVTVAVKGTTIVAGTSSDGDYAIDVPAGAETLVFSFVGYDNMEEPINGRTVINVSMKETATSLDAVVVTGYGNITKSAFTGSASTISTSKLANVPSISLESKLAGAAAGVKLASSSGQPGAMESVRIRGAGSIAASNEPLYVIDGVPMLTGNASGFSYSQTGNSLLSTINSNDIESITIIKDAGAASLYGSRAANGVIVITTKSGTSAKSSVSLRADFGFSDMAINYRPTLGGDERREILHAGLVNYMRDQNSQQTDPSKIQNPSEYANTEIDKYAEKPWSGWANWRDLVIRRGKQRNYEVNVQGSNDRTNFYSSLAYSQIEGITLKSDLNRITGRLNLNHKATDKFTFGLNTMYTNTKQNVYSEGTSYASPLMAISMAASPQDYPRNEDGTFNTTRKFLAMNNPRIVHRKKLSRSVERTVFVTRIILRRSRHRNRHKRTCIRRPFTVNVLFRIGVHRVQTKGKFIGCLVVQIQTTGDTIQVRFKSNTLYLRICQRRIKICPIVRSLNVNLVIALFAPSYDQIAPIRPTRPRLFGVFVYLRVRIFGGILYLGRIRLLRVLIPHVIHQACM